MIRMNCDALPPLFETWFRQMTLPQACDGLVLWRETGDVRECVTCADDGEQATMIWHQDDPPGRSSSSTLSRDEYARLLQRLVSHLQEVDAVFTEDVLDFTEDVLDGRSYLIRIVRGGRERRVFLGNPLDCEDSSLHRAVEELDALFDAHPRLARTRCSR